jgi:hypothetical protein
MHAHCEYQLTLRARSQRDDPEGIRRLRLALKRLLRGYGLTCVSVEPLSHEASGEQESVDTSPEVLDNDNA